MTHYVCVFGGGGNIKCCVGKKNSLEMPPQVAFISQMHASCLHCITAYLLKVGNGYVQLWLLQRKLFVGF